MGKTNIDWPGLTDTWNVHTGCPRGCSYCVVRNRVWPRIKHLYEDHDFTKVHFHPYKLSEYDNRKKPLEIFVNFYTDIEFVGKHEMDEILLRCYINEIHTYLFLSKSTSSYNKLSWPSNTMQGLTITFEDNRKDIDSLILHAMRPRPFISIEPIMGMPIKLDYNNFELVIVGAETGNRKGKVIPQKEWIQSIRDHVPAEKIYWKKNIQQYL